MSARTAATVAASCEGSEQCQGRFAGRLDAATLARDGRYGEPKTANRESGQVKVEAP
jgi:creatinine amidohydrolase/Fe(II)-dependent formamide hydrolase-like protein